MGRALAIVALLLAGLALGPNASANSAAAKAPELSERDHRKLDEGKLVVRIHRKGNDDGLVAGSVTGILEVTGGPADIWRAAMSFDVIPDHNKVMQEVEVYRQMQPATGHKVVDVRYHMRIFGRNIHYSIHHDLYPGQGLLRWNLDPDKDHDIEVIDGRIFTHPGRNPGTTLLVFTSKIDTGQPLPAFVENHLTKTALRDYLLFLKKLAEEE